MKPIILITHRTEQKDDGYGRLCNLRESYCEAIIRAGGVPVISAMGDAGIYADMADGILFSGGCDIEPHRYGEDDAGLSSCQPELDKMELELFSEFYKRKKPILGICRGIQLVNVALGGTLYQHVAGHTNVTHTVTTAQGSVARRLFGREMETNSFHHQTLKAIGQGLRVTATAADGTVEAVEHESYPLIATQWHPERMGDDMIPLFEHFVGLCGN